MTAIATELCRLIEKAEKIGDEEVEVVKLHIAALKLVIDEDMKSQGGKAGEKCWPGCNRFATSSWPDRLSKFRQNSTLLRPCAGLWALADSS